MTRPYSRDLRQRVVDAVEAGASRRATAGRFEVSVSFVIKLVQRFRRTGSLEPERYGGWKRSTVLAHAHLVRALLLAEPDLTLEELRHRLAGQGARVSTAALNRFLALDGLTRKKKTRHAAEQERPDVAEARAAWRKRQPAMSPERLVFIDETWATTHMARRHGRARRGQRVVSAIPHGHWKTTTFLAALRHDRITAPCVFDGAINGVRFLAYVEQALAPSLAPPGDVVILDNLGGP